MARVQRGDREAYAALLDDLRAGLRSFFRRRVDPAEVDDACQETLIALHRARHTYDPSRPFEPWLLAIARHVVADRTRRRARTPREVLVDAPPDVAVGGDGDARVRLLQAVERLPRAQREAFALVQVEGLSVAAAAARAGTTSAALKIRAHRAYKVLRELLRG